MSRAIRRIWLAGAVLGSLVSLTPAAASARQSFINRFGTISTLAGTAPSSGSAIGDQNPYGVAVVPRTTGDLVRGDVLVSNFNNAENQQGTGSSIVEVSPAGHQRVFAVVPQPTASPAVGLTTALVALRSGYVIVGLGAGGVLYVADSPANRIAAIPEALRRTSVLAGGGVTVSSGGALNDPLGVAIAANGDIVTADGGDGKIVETTRHGAQIATRTLVADGAGDLFGLAMAPGASGIYFVNDAGSGPAANSLQLLH